MRMPKLPDFLATKPLYYKAIDHERIHHAYVRLKPHIHRPQTVHIVGTNGKGSTGRFIAHLALHGKSEIEFPEKPPVSLDSSGSRERKRPLQGLSAPLSPSSETSVNAEKYGEYSENKNTQNIYPLPTTHYPLTVGHYTSPHILKFNERIWLNGADASDEVLEAAHQKLYAILGEEMSGGLSYFEYTTLLAFVVFEQCDLMVLEAGLGGEYDATNVCEKELSVFTPIGIDHQAFLGESIGEIAATKLRSMQPGSQALIAPQPYPETIEVAKAIAKERHVTLHFAKTLNSPLSTLNFPPGWPPFLIENAHVAMQALDLLHIPYDPISLESLELFGRFYPLLPNLRIDVGHNPLAARAIVEVMEPDTVLIYNSLDDKDYATVLQTLKPKLKRIEIIPIDSQRAATREAIESAVKATGLPYRYFDGTIEEREHYLVFGSFYVVEELLRKLGIRN